MCPDVFLSRPTMFGIAWCVVVGKVGSASAAKLTAAAVAALLSSSCFISSMGSIMEDIFSFKADMSAFIYSCTSSRSPIILDLDLVR